MKTAPLPAALGSQPSPATRASGKAAADTLNAFDAALLALMLGVPAATAAPAPEGAPAADPQAAPAGEAPAGADAATVAELVPELPASLLAMLVPLEPPPPAHAAPAFPADFSPEGAAAASLPVPGAVPAGARSPSSPDLASALASAAAPAQAVAPAQPTASPSTGLAPAAVPLAATDLPAAPKGAEPPETALLQSFAPALARAEEAALRRHEPAPEAGAPTSLPDFPPLAKAGTVAATSHAAAQAAAPLVGDPATPAWREGLAERVALHVRGGKTEAQIQLHPADLGPIDVRIKVEDGSATLQFEAHRPETRLAIEEAMPRLKEMLADSGLQFGGAQVGQGDGTGQGEARARSAFATTARQDAQAEAAPEAPRIVTVVPRGRVDLFA